MLENTNPLGKRKELIGQDEVKKNVISENEDGISTSSDSKDILPEVGAGKHNKELTWEEMTQEQKAWVIFKKKMRLVIYL